MENSNIKLLEVTITPENLHEHLDIITRTILPSSEDTFLHNHYSEILEEMPWIDLHKKLFKNSVLAYLKRTAYWDIYNTDHDARSKFCKDLRNNPETAHIGLSFEENSLHYDNKITSVFYIGSVLGEELKKQNAVEEVRYAREKLPNSDRFQRLEFEGKMGVDKNVRILSRYLCKELLH